MVGLALQGCPLQPDCKDFNAQVTQCFVDVMGALISVSRSLAARRNRLQPTTSIALLPLCDRLLPLHSAAV